MPVDIVTLGGGFLLGFVTFFILQLPWIYEFLDAAFVKLAGRPKRIGKPFDEIEAHTVLCSANGRIHEFMIEFNWPTSIWSSAVSTAASCSCK